MSSEELPAVQVIGDESRSPVDANLATASASIHHSSRPAAAHAAAAAATRYMCAPVDLEGALRTFFRAAAVSFGRLKASAGRIRSADGHISKVGLLSFLGVGALVRQHKKRGPKADDDDGDRAEDVDLEHLDALMFAKAIGPDLESIKRKAMYVLVPGSGPLRSAIADSPDRWGPFLCVALHCVVFYVCGTDPKVSWVFFIWLFGAGIVAGILNLLGRRISYGTVLCVLGYSTLPLTLCMPLLGILRFSAFHTLIRACGVHPRQRKLRIVTRNAKARKQAHPHSLPSHDALYIHSFAVIVVQLS